MKLYEALKLYETKSTSIDTAEKLRIKKLGAIASGFYFIQKEKKQC
jgi:hypothetical protein